MPSTQLTGYAMTAPVGPYSSDTTEQIQLGTRFKDTSGNEYVYAKVGGTSLVAGKLYQSPAEITDDENLTPAAAAIGATSVTVTLGSTAATANKFAGGWLLVTVTPGEGYRYRIASNPAASGAATCVIQLDDPIQVALTTSSRVDLIVNPYNGVVVNPTTATGTPVGVAVDVVANGTYGWLLCEGVANVLADGALAVGTNVCASNAVAGALEAQTGVQALVGTAITGVANTEYGAVYIRL